MNIKITRKDLSVLAQLARDKADAPPTVGEDPDLSLHCNILAEGLFMVLDHDAPLELDLESHS